MWCLSCFKSSAKPDPSGDLFETDLDIAIAKSRHEDEVIRQKRLEEDENLAWAIQERSNIEEFCRRRQQKEEEVRRRTRELEKDTQIAHAIQNEETEMQLHYKSALEDEEAKQIAKALEESLKERRIAKQLEDEQVKKDGELAVIIQERLNMSESPPRRDENTNISHRAPLNLDGQLAKALEESLKVKGKGKQLEDEQVKKDGALAVIFQKRLNMSPRASLDEDEQLSKAIEESLKERIIGKKREDEQMKKDGELAVIFQESLNMSPRASLDEYEQLVKAIEESLKERRIGKQLEDEKVKKDGELAVIFQESLNMSPRASLDEDEQLAKAIKENLKERRIGKQLEDEQVKKDGEFAVSVQESLNMSESPPRLKENNNISPRASLDEDEQLAKALEESLKGKGQIMQTEGEVDDGNLLEVNPPRSMCGGCNYAVEHSRSVNILGVLWHPRCFCCRACDKLISIYEVENHVSNSRGKFHESCYVRYCYVCKERKMKNYSHHPFWKELYCKSHETDGTPRCHSCERLEPKGTDFVMLDDGRWLCLECMESAVMDSDECQPLHFDMREFFEGLNMKIEKQFPFLLVEKQALNKAEKEEKIDCQYEVVTRGICLSEAQTVISVSKGPRMGAKKQLMGIDTESQWVHRECEVTAILILYGLPRLLTGYILAHEMMHAYLRLNGYRNINKVVEEGLCQVLGHMWLESQTYASADTSAASSSSSSTSAANGPKKGEWSNFEKKLVEFCKNQIETDESPVYGAGFRKVNHMVAKSSLQETLKVILRRS